MTRVNRATTKAALLQSLEARRLLSADLTPRGLLIIAGTENADTITVGFDAESAKITVEGATTEDLAFPARQVRGVIVRSGAGDDEVVIGELAQRTLVSLGEGDDVLTSSARFTHASGGDGNDEMTVVHEESEPAGGGSGAERGPREGENQRRRRFLSFAQVRLIGGKGDDVLTGSARARFNILVGADGSDELIGGTSARGQNGLLGGAGDDTLTGGPGRDLLQGAGGNDTLLGRAGDDLLNGGDGDDSILGEDGDDTLVGGPGEDTLDGGAGDNVIRDG